MAQYIEGTDRYQPMLLPAAADDYISPASLVRAIDANRLIKTKPRPAPAPSTSPAKTTAPSGTIALAPLHKTDTNGLYNNDRFTRYSATDSYTCPLSAWAYNFTRVISLVGMDMHAREGNRFPNAPEACLREEPLKFPRVGVRSSPQPL